MKLQFKSMALTLIVFAANVQAITFSQVTTGVKDSAVKTINFGKQKFNEAREWASAHKKEVAIGAAAAVVALAGGAYIYKLRKDLALEKANSQEKYGQLFDVYSKKAFADLKSKGQLAKKLEQSEAKLALLNEGYQSTVDATTLKDAKLKALQREYDVVKQIALTEIDSLNAEIESNNLALTKLGAKLDLSNQAFTASNAEYGKAAAQGWENVLKAEKSESYLNNFKEALNKIAFSKRYRNMLKANLLPEVFEKLFGSKK